MIEFCTQVSSSKARFISDAAGYMQNARAPARDVFSHTTQCVSSVVVVPLMRDGRAWGALYLTQETPW